MKAFASLVKRRVKAMAVFQKAKDDLVRVADGLLDERTKVLAKIAEEQEKDVYLSNQQAETYALIERINDFLVVKQ